MNKVSKSLLLLFIGGLLIWFLFGGNQRPVMVMESMKAEIRDSVVGNVKVFAASSFELRSTVDGIVSQVTMLPRSNPVKVESNQTLVQLQIGDLERSFIGLDLEKKQFEEREEVGSLTVESLKVMQKELDALEALVREGKAPALKLDLKRSEVNRLNSQVSLEQLHARHFLQNNQYKRANISNEIAKRRICSPIDGLFSECFVSPGNRVMKGDLVGVVHSHDKVIEVSLNEEDFVGLRDGLSAAVSLLSLEGQVLSARVSGLAFSVDAKSGLRKLYLSLDKNVNIPVGSTGRAEIILQEKKDCVVIPAKALLGDSVMLVKNGVVQKQALSIGARNLKTIEVIDGLGVGEKVIVETPHLFEDGDRVNPTLLKPRN